MKPISYTGNYCGQSLNFVKFALLGDEQAFKVSTLYLTLEHFKKEEDRLVIPRQIKVEISQVENVGQISSEFVDEIPKNR